MQKLGDIHCDIPGKQYCNFNDISKYGHPLSLMFRYKMLPSGKLT